MSDDDRRLASLGRALAAVEAGLREELDVAALAEAACYSIFHFVRVFTELTGHGPYDYLVRRRLAEAAREVVGGSRTLLDIALDYRFDSPEGFARAFRRCFGLAPSEARRTGAYPEARARTAVSLGYARASREAGISVRAETLPEAVVVGLPLVADAVAGAHRPGADVLLYPAPREGSRDGQAPGPITALSGRLEPKASVRQGSPGDDDGLAYPAYPTYPLVAATVPGGPALAVSGHPPLDLGLARDWLYRTALPVAGALPRGDLELVRLNEAGQAESLSCPLAVRASG